MLGDTNEEFEVFLDSTSSNDHVYVFDMINPVRQIFFYTDRNGPTLVKRSVEVWFFKFYCFLFFLCRHWSCQTSRIRTRKILRGSSFWIGVWKFYIQRSLKFSQDCPLFVRAFFQWCFLMPAIILAGDDISTLRRLHANELAHEAGVLHSFPAQLHSHSDSHAQSQLIVEIVEARNLASASWNGFNDTYVVVSFGDHHFVTSVKKSVFLALFSFLYQMQLISFCPDSKSPVGFVSICLSSPITAPF